MPTSQYGISENPRRRRKIKTECYANVRPTLLAQFLFAVPPLRFSIMGRLAQCCHYSLGTVYSIGSRTSGVERKKQRRRECGQDGWPNAMLSIVDFHANQYVFLTPIRRQAFVSHAEDLRLQLREFQTGAIVILQTKMYSYIWFSFCPKNDTFQKENGMALSAS